MIVTGNDMSRLGSVSYDQQNQDQKFTAEVFKVALISAIGGFLFGYDTGIVSGAMIYIKDSIQGPHRSLSYSWQVSHHTRTLLILFILTPLNFDYITGSDNQHYDPWSVDVFNGRWLVRRQIWST